MLERPRRWRSAGRARTIRLRLTILYGGVFLLTGAILLTIGYLLVRHNLRAAPDLHREARRLGGSPPPPRLDQTAFGPAGYHASEYRVLYDGVVASALHTLLLEYIGALVVMTGISGAR
jgi:hypothetical protein